MTDAHERPPRISRRIVGETWIEKDEVKKSRITKNTERMTIERTRHRAILLECGHAIPVTHFSKVPASNTYCPECERPAMDAYWAVIKAECDAKLIADAQDMPLTALEGLADHALFVLSLERITTVGELLELTEQELMARCNIKPGTVLESIRSALAATGRSIGMAIAPEEVAR